ncbi:seminal fluid protein CSSFP001, partial [Danaus plexippus plexippus]
NNMKKNSGADC